MGRALTARQIIVCLLSFRGYLSIPGAVRLLPLHHQNRWDHRHLQHLETERQQTHLQIQYQGEVTKLAQGNLGQESWENDNKDKNDPLAEMPFWLGEFTDDMIPTEVPAPAQISQDSEHSTNVATKSRNHSIFTHFPKDRNCDVCLRNNIPKASCRSRTGEALPRAEKFGDLMTADHKVLNEGCESRDNHRCRGTRSFHSLDSTLSV